MKYMTFISDLRWNFGKLQKKTITLKDLDYCGESEWEDVVDEKEQYRTNNTGDGK